MSATPQLYLVFEAVGDAATVQRRLDLALSSASIASVLLTGGRDAAITHSLAAALVPTVQDYGVAALIADDPEIARRVKADGVHISWSKDPGGAYRSARDEVGSHTMVGVDAGRSRHDAMELGEGGADYVAFGIPAHVGDRETAEARQVELVSWWSEIFEVPSVAFNVNTVAQAEALARAGADFITVDIPAEMADADIAAHIREIVDAVAGTGIAA